MNIKIIGIIGFSIVFCFVFLSGCTASQDTGRGTLNFTSSPSGAEVYLNDQFRGNTPCTIAGIEPGNYTLEFRYPGYQSWTTGIVVASGPSNFYAALSPSLSPPTPSIPSQTTTVPATVTVTASKDTMIVGNSNLFTGTCIGCDSVGLTLFGPGYYAQGVSLDQSKINSAGLWSYTWNPGYSIQSGQYVLVVNDARKTTSERVEFSVIGGGIVSIASNSYSANKGDVLKFSGQCTSGARNVALILYGPQQFSGGVNLGTISVTADNSWNFKYTLDSYMPTGTYTIYVYDIPTTATSNTQFTVGFAS